MTYRTPGLVLALGALGVLPLLPEPRRPSFRSDGQPDEPPALAPSTFEMVERAMAIADEERRVGEEILRSFDPGPPNKREKRRSAAERKERRKKRCQRVRARRAAG